MEKTDNPIYVYKTSMCYVLYHGIKSLIFRGKWFDNRKTENNKGDLHYSITFWEYT